MNEVEQETVQDNDRENNIESMCIDSIQFNENYSVLTTNLKISAGQSNIMVPYKIYTGSNGNIMLLHVCLNYFQRQQMGSWHN